MSQPDDTMMQSIQDFGHGFGGMVLHFPDQISLVALIGGLASGCRTRDSIKIQIVLQGVTVAFITHQNGMFTLKGILLPLITKTDKVPTEKKKIEM